jgi:hypothetical protein
MGDRWVHYRIVRRATVSERTSVSLDGGDAARDGVADAPVRWPAIFILLFVVWALYMRVHTVRVAYWLSNDGRQATARVIKEHWAGHDAVVYEYAVNGTQYTGVSSRTWKDPKYSHVQPGEETPVFYSESHPWISLLYMPDGYLDGWPFDLGVNAIGFLAIVTLINPNHRWALRLSSRR